MATWRSLPLLVLGALMSVECTQILQYSPTSVVCSGSCCPECLNDLQKQEDTCEGWNCEGAEYAIDNNLQTLWNSSAQYSNTMPTSIGLTLDLGQERYGIQRIEIYGKASISQLRISMDGVSFDSVDTVVNDAESNKLEVEPVLPSLGVPQARYIHLHFSDVELPEIAEIYILISQESGGFCTLQLIDQLGNIIGQIRLAFQAFGDNQQIETIQELLRKFQDFIGKVEINVPRLQTTLEDKASLQTSRLLKFETSQIYEELQDISSDLQSLLQGSVDYNEAICDLETRVASVSDELNSQLDVIMRDITETSEVSASINEQSFASDNITILMHKSAAERSATNSYLYLTSTESINARVTAISAVLGRSTIESLGLLATSVQEVVSDSGNKSAILDTLLMELENSVEGINLGILSYDGLVNDSALKLSRGQTLLSEVRLELMLSSIMFLTSLLENNIGEYQASINAYDKCNPPVCTLGQTHAEMLFQNSSFFLNVSLFTLQRGRAFVDALFNLTGPFSFADIRSSALLALNISGVINSQLEDAGFSDLYTQSSLLEQTSFVLNDERLRLLSRAKDLGLMLELFQEKRGILSSLLDELSLLVTNFSSVRERLSIQADQAESTDQLQLDTEYTRNLTEILSTRVSSIDIDAFGTVISDTSTNTENASRALDTSFSKFENAEIFINATRRAISKYSANVSEFVAENTRIIGEIDAVIASLGDIHTRINMINSPVVLESIEEQDGSFLSLQPPLDRPLNDTIQFESIDLYFWTGPQFRTPTILFYLGPLCLMNTCDLSDFFIVLLENGGVINIQWRIGSEKGTVSQAGFQLGFSQLHIARVGASFEMRYGVSIGELGNPFTFGRIINDSILFTTSNRTAYLLGGAPNGLQLGVVKDAYASFEGQIQQVLFNGEQWGLWNIRSASDTIFYGDFQRNELAIVNAWHASSTSTAAAISFDGAGYLYVDQFSSLSSFSSQFRTMDITIRPNDERDGLVLFAFDPQMNLSMEIFFQAGNLHLLIVRHDNNLTLVDYVQELDSSITSRRERELEIEFLEGVGFRANGNTYLDSSAIFFNDLTNVQAWFGGINETEGIDKSFAPTGTLSGYFGCVDITVQYSNTISSIFEGDHFINQYLDSPVQRGFSATCFQTVYASEVGFDGTPKAFLTYRFLEPVVPPNSPSGVDQSRQNLITFSFNSQRMEGIVLVLQNREGDELFIVLKNSFIEVRISLAAGERFTLMSKEMVDLMEWHNVLLQFRSGVHKLYLDGILQASYEALSTLNIQSMSVVPEDPEQPPAVFVGGIDDTLRSSSNETLPSFTGCIRDLTYGHEAFSFFSTSQSLPRYPSGVTYHSCPFLSTSTVVPPVLPVRPDQPEPSLCVPSPSVTNTSLGSFHRQTQLNTSNIIGLLQSSWSMEVILLYKADGHILSIATAEGYFLSLFVDNKLPKFLLGDGEVSGPELKENESAKLAVYCFTDSMMISCSLIVDDIQSEASFIEAAGSFTPEPPIILGQATLYNGSQVDSFVGCINSLSINRDTNGFDDLYTGQPCYNNDVRGIGFSGISLVEKELLLPVNEPLTVALTFKPARADGLLMLLTTNNNSKAIFAAGLRNGRVHVSNLNGLSEELQVDICDPNNSTFSTLEVKLENNSITVTSGSSVTLPTANINEVISVSIGNAPDNFAEDQLLFLLSEGVNQAGFLPGFIGCVLEVNINGVIFSDLSDLSFDEAQDIMVGICPL